MAKCTRLGLPVAPSRMPADSRSASSSTAALDCAHTSTRGPVLAAAPGGCWAAPAPQAPISADTSATIVLVLPVPGGPCTRCS